ncbi:MAG: acetylglutamate kinase [Spirochaetia bacterium]
MGIIVIKIGGKAAEKEESLGALCDEMLELSRENRFLLVHGGGAEVTALSKKLGIEPVFKDGIRQTTPEEMDIVDMVLAGKVNKRLVRLLRARGLDAVGLSGADGGIVTGVPLGVPAGKAANRTGEVASIDERLLELLLGSGFLPVLSSVSSSTEGLGLNINADSLAFGIAAHLKAAALVFFSDIPGILCDGSVLQAPSAAEARELISRGVITGGMIPKVTASLDALERGVQKVIIGQYESRGSLARLMEGKQGTRLWK